MFNPKQMEVGLASGLLRLNQKLSKRKTIAGGSLYRLCGKEAKQC